MSADISSTERRSEPGSRRRGLSVLAWAYLVLIAGECDAARLARPRPGRRRFDTKTWVAFGLIAVGAALAQLFPVVTPRDQSYHTTMVVLVPAALLLPTWLLPAVVVAQHVPEWLKVRYPWYIQTFNASNYLLDLFAAAAVGRYVLGAGRPDHERRASGSPSPASPQPSSLVLLNHADPRGDAAARSRPFAAASPACSRSRTSRPSSSSRLSACSSRMPG